MIEAVEVIFYTPLKKIVSIGDATEVFIGLEIYIINYWGYDGYTYT